MAEEIIGINGAKVEPSEMDYFKVEPEDIEVDVPGVDNKQVGSLEIDDSDDVILTKAIAMTEECKSNHVERLEEYEDNDRFFDGDIWKGVKQEFQSDMHVNRIMPTVRSVVGLLTDGVPVPEIEASPSDDLDVYNEDKAKARNVDNVIMKRWKEAMGQRKLTRACYYMIIYNDAFFLPYWDEEDDDVNFNVAPPHTVMIPDSATSIDNAPYIDILRYRTKNWLRDREEYEHALKKENYEKLEFEKDANEKTGWWENIKNKLSLSSADSQREYPELSNTIVVHEVWTKYARVVYSGEVLLEKEVNPYWADEARSISEGVENYFRKPQIPVIALRSMDLGEAYSRSLFEQLKSIQKGIDRRKQQIDENATLTSNSQIVYDTDLVDQETMENNVTNEPGLLIGVSGGPNSVARLSPDPLPNYVMNDLAHSEQAFNDIIGHHEISQGRAMGGRQSATEAAILKESDITPVRLLSREIDMALTSLFRWWVQMMKLYYNEEHYIENLGVEDALEPLESEEELELIGVTSEDIPSDLWVGVKQGSTMTINKDQRKMEAVQLAQGGMLDPMSLYEILEYPSPEKYAERLQAFMQGQLVADEEKNINEAVAQEGAKAAAQGGQPPAGQSDQPAQTGQAPFPPPEL